jgi:DNA-binding GntR family transcriptional regulator
METIKQAKTLVDQTYDILLDAICGGEFAPGDRLNQDEIAARLNVSRQPVNSAISILRANGFVRDTGRRGVVVSEIETALFQPIFEFRRVIEPFAVELAGERMPKDAKAEAEVILLRGEAAARGNDMRSMVQADVEFHAMVYGWSGNPVIESSMRLNWHHIRRSMAQNLRSPGTAEPVWQEHRAIVEALLAGDVANAKATMHGHIDTAGRRILAAIRAKEQAQETGAA